MITQTLYPHRVELNNDIRLLGGWNQSFSTEDGLSTLDGQGLGRVIYVVGAWIVDMQRFVIQNGFSEMGGGIFNSGVLRLNNSHVINNHTDSTVYASLGSGICNRGNMIIDNSSISGNAPQVGGSWGGGIYNWRGSLILTNSTVSGNIGSRAGGIYNFDGAMILNSSTISDNRARGIFNEGNVFLGHFVIMQNTILASNSVEGLGQDCLGKISSSGYNLIGDTTDCEFIPTEGDLTDMEPLIGLLEGSPGYHPLLPGSPAIDAGNPGGCTDNLGNFLNTDQRGIARVGRCDIGAYEYMIRYIHLPLISR